MVAKDIMTTQVLTVKPSISIKEALRLLVEIEISGLIVVNEANDIIGVVTGKDILVAYDFLKQTQAPIDEYINRDVVSVKEDTPIEEISRLLVQGNIKLPDYVTVFIRAVSQATLDMK